MQGAPDPLADPLHAIDQWPVPTAAAAVVRLDGTSSSHGSTNHQFALASLTKPLFAYAVLIAVEEGTLMLDDPISDDPLPDVPLPHGSPITVRQLLAHASGLGPEAADPATTPLTRRIYSNAGFELLGRTLSDAASIPGAPMSAADYFSEAVAKPLHLGSTSLPGSPAHSAISTVNDLSLVLAEWLNPTLISPATMAEATTAQFPDLDGVLPGYGRQSPNPWGLGFEIRGQKSPHWTGSSSSPATFGHFGRAGTMIWIDPSRGLGCVALTDRTFGGWAAEAWPPFNDSVLNSA